MFRLIRLLILIGWCLSAQAAIIAGDPHGNMTVVVVYDYQCSHCHEVFPHVLTLMDQYPNIKIRFIPVAMMNSLSLYEASAAIAATKKSGKFQVLNTLLMSEPMMDQSHFLLLLKKLDLTSPDFKHDMHAAWVKKQLMEGLTLMRIHNAGTPLIIMYPTRHAEQSTVFKGVVSYKTLQQGVIHASYSL